MMNDSKLKKTNFSFDALKGMQSVRATFTLPKHTINLLTAVANQLGVKQKSIFDHLIEDKSVLDQIADPYKSTDELKTAIEKGKCMDEFQ